MSVEELAGYDCLTTAVTDACPCITAAGPSATCPRTVRARPARSSGHSVSHSKLVPHDGFV
jgi:hypothetical protein